MFRADMIEGLKAEMSDWFWDAASPVYKKLKLNYPEIVEVESISKITGPYYKGTSAIGASELQDNTEDDEIYEDHPVEGFKVYGSIKTKALKVKVPRALKRDWHRTKDFLKSYVYGNAADENGQRGNWPLALEVTKEKIVANLFNYGGFTSGHATFNQEEPTVLETGKTYVNLPYDDKPLFSLTGNNHTAKNGGTYYNALAETGVTFENYLTMYNLLTATNNRMENGEPFDNSQDLRVICYSSLAPSWESVITSEKNADDASNANNPLRNKAKVFGNPYITTSTMSVLMRKGGIRCFFSDPIFEFWEEHDPARNWASVTLDYCIFVQNWRTFVSNNAPTA